MSQVPVVPSHPIEGTLETLPRRCGRCRVLIEDDPDLDSVAQSGWSLCAPCELVLLPNHQKRADAAERRQVTARHAE